MNYNKDYYKILQVHYLAEQEVIESSYKRLAKKYHPDINKNPGSEEAMKEINEAYEILKNSEKRKNYHIKWVKSLNKQNDYKAKKTKENIKDNINLSNAKMVLSRYFQNLLNRDFEKAYALIAETDKKNISKEDFIKWQNTVLKVYQLKEYKCSLRKISKDMLYNEIIYNEAIDLYVVVMEYNEIIDRYEKDYFVKTIILENNNWKVLLGYEGLQPLIDKFESLSELIKAKPVIREILENRSKTDYLTGLKNIKGFLEIAEKEAYRYKRYNSIFSLAFCEISIQEDKTIKAAAKIIKRNLRKLDVIGRWHNSTFIVLLPETDINKAIIALKKIQRLLEHNLLIYKKRKSDTTLSFGVVEYRHKSIKECLDKASYYKDLAKNLKGNTIVSSEGIV